MTDNVWRILLAASTATTMACGDGARTMDNAGPPLGTDVTGTVARPPAAGLTGGTTTTVIGCLRRGNQVGTYLLRVSRGHDGLPPAAGPAASSASGSADVAPADLGGARAFLVAAPAGENLSSYENAEIEVSGSVQPPSLEAMGRERAEAERPHGNPNAPGAAAAGGVRAGDTAGADPPPQDMPALFRTIQAERVRRIADSCEDR